MARAVDARKREPVFGPAQRNYRIESFARLNVTICPEASPYNEEVRLS